MKDIPMFTTEYGVASLVLSQIPYRQTAYIHIRDARAEDGEMLLQECRVFCRMCGAERIYAAEHPCTEKYPLHTVVYEMTGQVERDGRVANLFPVTSETVGQWREIYNQRMKAVDHAATLPAFEEKKLLEAGGAYFIHEDGALLGIGWMEDDKLLAVASVKPGEGNRVLKTLLDTAKGDTVRLEVASTNEKAIRLYEQAGFLKTGKIRKWYQIL